VLGFSVKVYKSQVLGDSCLIFISDWGAPTYDGFSFFGCANTS
jgi:hypothetical protein